MPADRPNGIRDAVCPYARGRPGYCFARATDQGQPKGAKGVALYLSTSQAIPFGEGMLQTLTAETAAALTTLAG